MRGLMRMISLYCMIYSYSSFTMDINQRPLTKRPLTYAETLYGWLRLKLNPEDNEHASFELPILAVRKILSYIKKPVDLSAYVIDHQLMGSLLLAHQIGAMDIKKEDAQIAVFGPGYGVIYDYVMGQDKPIGNVVQVFDLPDWNVYATRWASHDNRLIVVQSDAIHEYVEDENKSYTVHSGQQLSTIDNAVIDTMGHKIVASDVTYGIALYTRADNEWDSVQCIDKATAEVLCISSQGNVGFYADVEDGFYFAIGHMSDAGQMNTAVTYMKNQEYDAVTFGHNDEIIACARTDKIDILMQRDDNSWQRCAVLNMPSDEPYYEVSVLAMAPDDRILVGACSHIQPDKLNKLFVWVNAGSSDKPKWIAYPSCMLAASYEQIKKMVIQPYPSRINGEWLLACQYDKKIDLYRLKHGEALLAALYQKGSFAHDWLCDEVNVKCQGLCVPPIDLSRDSTVILQELPEKYRQIIEKLLRHKKENL